jgi:hypothetical protein
MFRNLAIVRYAAVLVLFTATSVSAAEFGTPKKPRQNQFRRTHFFTQLIHAALTINRVL